MCSVICLMSLLLPPSGAADYDQLMCSALDHRSSMCVRCDMAFIEPMHRNKPNITYFLTSMCVVSSV